MKRVAIMFSGGGSNMVRLIECMIANDIATPVLALTNNPDAGGLTKATDLGVPTSIIDHRDFPKDRAGFDNELTKTLNTAGVDLVCLAGFMRIFTPEFAANWSNRMINIHPSLLPKYPGLNTHARAIEAGDDVAGCSVHWVTEDLDAGPIAGQAQVPVLPNDSLADLAARVLVAEHRLYPIVLSRILQGDKLPIYL